MTQIEEFYFSDGDEGGEKLFTNWAAEKHSIFADNLGDAESDTNKPE